LADIFGEPAPTVLGTGNNILCITRDLGYGTAVSLQIASK